MQISRARSGARILGLALTALAIAVPAAAQAKEKAKEQHVQLLAINDLHGHLEPEHAGHDPGRLLQPGAHRDGVQTGWTQKTVPAGGIAYLATHIKAAAGAEPEHASRSARAT